MDEFKMRVWVCTVKGMWAHTMMNSCVTAANPTRDVRVKLPEMVTKPTHLNCGWYLFMKDDEKEEDDG